MQAKNLLPLASTQLLHSRKISVKFSNCWIVRFKKLYGLCFRRVHGEETGADNKAFPMHMLRLREITTTYADKDVRNSNDSGLLLPSAEPVNVKQAGVWI